MTPECPEEYRWMKPGVTVECLDAEGTIVKTAVLAKEPFFSNTPLGADWFLCLEGYAFSVRCTRVRPMLSSSNALLDLSASKRVDEDRDMNLLREELHTLLYNNWDKDPVQDFPLIIALVEKVLAENN